MHKDFSFYSYFCPCFVAKSKIEQSNCWNLENKDEVGKCSNFLMRRGLQA